jgi:phosphohistidine phosphatase SixA
MKKEHRKLRRRPLFTPLLAPFLGGVVFVLALGWLWNVKGTTTVILVRHADVQQLEEGGVELNDTGYFRSRSLAGWLRTSGITRIFISDYPPTRMTAEPVAKALGAEIVEIPAAETGRLIDELAGAKGDTVLVIGQAETLPDVIDALSGQRPDIAQDDYSGLYIIVDSVLSRARLLTLRYGG